MKNNSYEELNIRIKDTSDAIIDKDIFYKCLICQSIIPSMPKDNTRCKCFNIDIDKDIHRLYVGDYSKFVILRKK